MAYFDCIVGGSGKGNTLVVTCADDLAGATISCTNGIKTYRKTCPSTSPYEVTFYGLEAGTWTVSATVSGDTYTTTVVITDYEAELGGFNWKAWVDLSENYTSSDFTDLDDLLSDETAVRELMTIHACVDYLAGIATESADVETIIGNDLCAKWINLRDYALDTLYANTIIADYMDTADKYGYGEWALVGQVPTMTSNTAPYGEVSASSEYSSSYPSWKVFDNNLDTSSSWISNGQTNQWVSYKFVKPTRINAVSIYAGGAGDVSIKNFRVEVSNDGTTYTPIYTGVYENRIETQYFTFDNDTAYLYYRLYIIDRHTTDTRNIQFAELQFYAWQPKGNVPIMTANNAPYGTVIASGENSGNPAYIVFSGKGSSVVESSNIWGGTARTNQSIGYKFTNPINVRSVKLLNAIANHGGRTKTFKVQASNDGFASDIQDLTDSLILPNDGAFHTFDVNNSNYYLGYRIYIIDNYTSDTNIGLASLQFYGRELSVSVPTMTSDTTPYGQVIYLNQHSASLPAWQAFDKTNNEGAFANAVNNYIGYDFKKSVVCKMVVIKPDSYNTDKYKIKGYDGSSWVDVSSEFTAVGGGTMIIDLTATTAYEKYVVMETTKVTSNNWCAFYEISFYGLDYSEKEFEEGTTKKWLYDHGVELEEMKSYIASGGVVTKRFDDIYQMSPDMSQARIYTEFSVTNYSLLRAKLGKEITYYTTSNVTSTNHLTVIDETSGGTGTSTARAYITQTVVPYDASLSVSSLSNGWPCIYGDGHSKVTTLTELWLE